MLNLVQIAEKIGKKPETVRHYLKESVKDRKNGAVKPHSFPLPARRHEGANEWEEADIEAWISAMRSKPTRLGAIPKARMREVLEAAEAGNLVRVISIAKDALA